MAKGFDWDGDHAGERKAAFHRAARRGLQDLADGLGLARGTYEIRSNKGGPAVSGEVTLHGENVYVQASQPFASRNGLLVRTCDGRRDFTGGHNNLLPLRNLDDTSALVAAVRRIQPALAPVGPGPNRAEAGPAGPGFR